MDGGFRKTLLRKKSLGFFQNPKVGRIHESLLLNEQESTENPAVEYCSVKKTLIYHLLI